MRLLYFSKNPWNAPQRTWNARKALELPSNGEVKSRGPRKFLIFGESGGLGRPLIKWSGISHCDPSAECEVQLPIVISQHTAAILVLFVGRRYYLRPLSALPHQTSKSHRFRDGIILFLLSRIYSLPSTFGTPEGQLEQPQASGTREALWNGPPLTRGVRGVFCLGSILFSGVVRLLERAEEGCEGLKHGCYDLPCVYFLSSLCHDIKNKIDRLVFK